MKKEMNETKKRTIFDINADMLALVNDETGEVEDFDKFEALQLERNKKVENACMLYLDLTAQAKAVADKAKELTERAKRLKSQAEKVESYVDFVLDGQKFSTENVEVKYSTSDAVEVDDTFIEKARATSPELLRIELKCEPDKTKIKEAIKSGEVVEGATLVSRRNIKIK